MESLVRDNLWSRDRTPCRCLACCSAGKALAWRLAAPGSSGTQRPLVLESVRVWPGTRSQTGIAAVLKGARLYAVLGAHR